MPERACFVVDGEMSFALTEGKTMQFCENPTSNLLLILLWHDYQCFEPQGYNVFVQLAHQ